MAGEEEQLSETHITSRDRQEGSHHIPPHSWFPNPPKVETRAQSAGEAAFMAVIEAELSGTVYLPSLLLASGKEQITLPVSSRKSIPGLPMASTESLILARPLVSDRTILADLS